MGVTINYKLGQEKKYLKDNLNRVQKVAELYKKQAKEAGLEMVIKRYTDYELFIDIDGCETLAFEFATLPEKLANNIAKKQEWDSEYDIKDFKNFDNSDHKHLENYPDQIMMFTSGFCKTQFCKSISGHEIIASIIKIMAGFCQVAIVNDEGDFYHNGKIESAINAISENGALINSIGGMLGGMGYEVKKGGE